MTTLSNKAICIICNKEKITYVCRGCAEHFCLDHLPEHRNNLGKNLDEMENDYDGLRQNFNDQKPDLTPHPLMKEIDQWEQDSIDKIKRAADQCREKLIKYTKRYFLRTEKELNRLSEQIKETRRVNDFNEIDLNDLKQRLLKLQEELLQPSNISIEQQSAPFINNISVPIPIQKDTRWEQSEMTIAGGNGYEDELNQLCWPIGICVDDNDQTIYIADYGNARIVEWKANETNGRIVAGGNRQGNQTNQLDSPRDVIIDREKNSLTIADRGHRRVMRWCEGVKEGIIVVGGNGPGNQANQLHHPTSLSFDGEGNLYVAEFKNHRIQTFSVDTE